MTQQEFISEVRDELSIMGLPLNSDWQPPDSAIRYYYLRLQPKEVAAKYKQMVKRYEAFVNKGRF